LIWDECSRWWRLGAAHNAAKLSAVHPRVFDRDQLMPRFRSGLEETVSGFALTNEMMNWG